MIKVIKLVRHGESESNARIVDPRKVGDHRIKLTEKGKEQALAAGKELGADYIKNSLFYGSPWHRTRETARNILDGAGIPNGNIRIYEDPRLCEVESGYGDVPGQEALRELHGWYWYRFEGGESPNDAYSRVSTFLESFMRQAIRKNIDTGVIVTHGRTMRVFAMRFLHLTVEDFNRMDNPHNCDIYTIANKETLENPVFTNGRWGVTGVKLRKD